MIHPPSKFYAPSQTMNTARRPPFFLRLFLATTAFAFVVDSPVYSQFAPAEPPPMAPAEFAPDYVEETWKWSIRTDTIPGYLYSVEESSDLVNWTLVPNSYFYGNGTQLKCFICNGPPPPSQNTNGNSNGNGSGAWPWQVHHFSLTLRMKAGITATSYFLQRETSDPASPNAWQTNFNEPLPPQVEGSRYFSMLEWADPTTHLLYWVDVHVFVSEDTPPTADSGLAPGEEDETDLVAYENIKPQLIARLLTPVATTPPSNNPSISKFARIRRTAIDSNDNGYPDWYEYANFGPDSVFALEGSEDYVDGSLDSDGDGFTNAEEVAGGTDPDLDSSHPPETTYLAVATKSINFDGSGFGSLWGMGNSLSHLITKEINWKTPPTTKVYGPGYSSASAMEAALPDVAFPDSPDQIPIKTEAEIAPVTGIQLVGGYKKSPNSPLMASGSAAEAHHWLVHKPVSRGPVERYYLLTTSKTTPATAAELEVTYEIKKITVPKDTTHSETASLEAFPSSVTPDNDDNTATVGISKTLLPVEFITKDEEKPEPFSITGIGPTNQAPIVELDEVGSGDVSISGDTATLSISGTIRDALMDNIPPGKDADIENAKIYVNGEFDSDVSLTRETDGEATFWRNYPAKITIPTTEVTIPVGGVASIRIETDPNASGIRGSAEITVEFDEDREPTEPVGGYTRSYHLTFSGANSETTADTLTISRGTETTEYTLTETGADTLLFKSPTEDTLQFAVRLLNRYTAQPTTADEIQCNIQDSGFSDALQGAGIQHFLCQETGADTGVFDFEDSQAGISLSYTSTYTVGTVTTEEAKPRGGNHPFTFRLAKEKDEEEEEESEPELKFKLGAEEFETVDLEGYSYPKLDEDRKVIAYLIRNESEDEDPATQELLYYDEASSTLKRQVLTAEASQLMLKILIDSEEKNVHALKMGSLTFIGHDGDPMEEISRVSAQTLVDLIDGDTTVEIEDDSWEKIRVKPSGDPEGITVRIQSSEIESDYFDLMLDPQGDGKIAALVEKEDGFYESELKIVVYHSDEGIETLSETQWNALKAKGYLAVHNATAKGLVKVLNKTLDGTSTDIEEHHLFPQDFRARFAKLFPSDFDIDDYCVPIAAERHGPLGKDWNAQIKTVLDTYTDPSGNLKPGFSINKAREEVFEEVLDLRNPNSLCNKFDVHPEKVIRWKYAKGGKAAGNGLPTAAKFAKMISKYGGVKLKENVGHAIVLMESLAAKAGKKGLGLARKNKAIGLVLGAWMLLNNGPKAAAAEFFDVTQAGVDAMLEGQVRMGGFDDILWDPNGTTDMAELQSGEVIKEGDNYWMAKVSALGIVEWVAEGEVDYITPTSVPGVVDVRVQFGAEARTFYGITSFRGEIPVAGQPWPYD